MMNSFRRSNMDRLTGTCTGLYAIASMNVSNQQVIAVQVLAVERIVVGQIVLTSP